MIQPTMTREGATRRAIWIEEPTATPMARSILSRSATATAVTCSATLPTLGIKIRPMKPRLIPEVVTRLLVLSTR
ncbi:hypothetical protein NOF04DRAFT_1337289, partial [Fusarium oxysporum II5]